MLLDKMQNVVASRRDRDIQQADVRPISVAFWEVYNITRKQLHNQASTDSSLVTDNMRRNVIDILVPL